ncbi:hypothetical protein KM043_011862 [Ampulex compressa]|nr:hypothetical protein KM043_011862 [Ampulex compressa]
MTQAREAVRVRQDIPQEAGYLGEVRGRQGGSQTVNIQNRTGEYSERDHNPKWLVIPAALGGICFPSVAASCDTCQNFGRQDNQACIVTSPHDDIYLPRKRYKPSRRSDGSFDSEQTNFWSNN